MTYVYLTDAASLPAGLRVMNMYNKAGNFVQPTAESIQSAMADFSDDLDAGNFAVDIYDGNGTATWPISFLVYISVARNTTKLDCTYVQEVLNLVAWAQTNDAYSPRPNYHPSVFFAHTFLCAVPRNRRMHEAMLRWMSVSGSG